MATGITWLLLNNPRARCQFIKTRYYEACPNYFNSALIKAYAYITTGMGINRYAAAVYTAVYVVFSPGTIKIT
jgi:hypothetical protein